MNPMELMAQGNLSMEQLIDQIKDPQTKMMAQMMAKRQTESSPPAQRNARTLPPAVEVMRQDIRELIRINKELIQKQQSLDRRYEQLRIQNATVASALGACVCWGQDAACPVCRGDGRPGTQDVNQEAFGELIAPFFQTLMGQLEAFKENAVPES